MPEQHLLPVALPRGITGKTGRITVYFSPRLKESGVLDDYPEWMNWPKTLDRMNIRLRLMTDTKAEWVGLTRVSALPELLKWRNLFDPSTPVDPHRFVDWSAAPYQTVATSDFNEAVLDMYTGIAVSHSNTPPSDDDVVVLPYGRRLNSAVENAIEYLNPMESKDADRLEEPADPLCDFHAYVSLLGGHPELLRHLGIAVDYEFTLPDDILEPSSVAIDTNYRDVVNNGPGREVLLITHSTKSFYAEPNPDTELREQTDGFLELANQKAYLSILDSYSTATRLASLENTKGQLSEPVPALITRALTLVRPDLLKAFKNRTQRQAKIEEEINDQLNPAEPRLPVELYAEDVTIGHRIDVLHKNTDNMPWLGLFDRQTDAEGYQFTHADDTSLNVHPSPDEGWTQTLLVTELEEDLSTQVSEKDEPLIPTAIRRLDDQLYRWDGWSGAVGRPNCVLDGVKGDAVEVAPQLPASDTAVVQFAANYEVVPGSLPQLRFGETYSMRARCVDLAGNSVDLDAVSPAGTETPLETFGRLEPIAAPFIVRRSERPYPGVGDDALAVVLLGDYDIEDTEVAGQERLLFPAKVGQDLCELHGEPEGGADAGSYSDLASRDARDPELEWGIDSVTNEPIAQGAEQQDIEYLSDPLIGKLRAYRWGPEGGEYLADLTGTWPATTSARFELVAGAQDTQVNPESSTEFRFGIGKADIMATDFSYAPRDGKVEEFGLWHRIPQDEQDDLRAIIGRGGHWMFSPRRSVQMVYAVRRPLEAPDFEEFCTPEVCRTADDTGVEFDATLFVDRRSTGSLNLRATWTDLVDDVNQDGPLPVDSGAGLGRFDTPRKADPDCQSFTIANHRAELGDTRRHYAQLHAEAFSYFSSYFTEERVVKLTDDLALVDERGMADGTVTVRHGEENLEAEQGVDFEVFGIKGTIQTLPKGVIKPGSELTVRYIPLPVSRTNDEYPAVHVIFPNTATPPPPQLDTVIPAASRTVNEKSISHDGRMLRVYLQRPWNVTGDGECLAVLIEREPGGVPAATRLGRDPVVQNAQVLPILDQDAFINASSVVTKFDGVHDLALHQVEYDPESKRWFTDIAVATDLYRPFLQLVIARYQADSITGKRLSSSVSLEPARLGVSRNVEVEILSNKASIAVHGREHAGIPGLDKTSVQNEVTVTLQEADPGIVDADLRWTKNIETIILSRTAGPDGSSWNGEMTFGGSATLQRLLIEESEPALFGGEKPELTTQEIYSEVVELPAS